MVRRTPSRVRRWAAASVRVIGVTAPLFVTIAPKRSMIEATLGGASGMRTFDTRRRRRTSIDRHLAKRPRASVLGLLASRGRVHLVEGEARQIQMIGYLICIREGWGGSTHQKARIGLLGASGHAPRAEQIFKKRYAKLKPDGAPNQKCTSQSRNLSGSGFDEMSRLWQADESSLIHLHTLPSMLQAFGLI